MRQYQPSILTCDFCGEQQSEEGLIGWVEVSNVGIATRSNDALYQDRQFCSLQHAAVWLLSEAVQVEILGPEAMKMLGRSAVPTTEDKP